MKLYDVYVSSTELKKLIVQRSFDYQIPLLFLCNEVGIKYSVFMKSYVNARNTDQVCFTEEQFTDLLNLLGIEVRYNFVVHKNKDMDAISKELERKHG